MTARVASALVMLILTACAGPASFQTESTVGRIAARTALERGPAAPVEMALLVPMSGTFVPVTVQAMRTPAQSYVYAFRYGVNELLLTQSTREFAVGACVKLWHAPLAESTDPQYNFVSGTLESANECN